MPDFLGYKSNYGSERNEICAINSSHVFVVRATNSVASSSEVRKCSKQCRSRNAHFIALVELVVVVDLYPVRCCAVQSVRVGLINLG